MLACASPVEAPVGGIVRNVTATAYFDNPGPTEIPIEFQVNITGKDPSVAPTSITVEYPGHNPRQASFDYAIYDDGFGYVIAEYSDLYPIADQTMLECTVHVTTTTDQFDRTIPITVEEGFSP